MKKPLFVMITDTHLFEKRSEEDSLLQDNFETVRTVFINTILLAKSLGLKYIFHGGDLFHSRKSQSVDLQDWFTELLDLCSDNGITLIIIPGNHDKTSYRQIKSFLRAFKHNPGMILVETTASFDVGSNTRVHMIPYFDDDLYVQMVDRANRENQFGKRNILITHIGINGAMASAGKAIKSEQVTVDIFEAFDKVLVGHYHDYSKLKGGKIVYVGSTHQHNFGENKLKGATIVYDDLSLAQQSLGTPEYTVFDCHVETFDASDLAALKTIAVNDEKVRVILHGTEDKVKAFDRKILSEIGVDVKSEITMSTKQEIDKRVDKFDSDTLQKQFKSFCTSKSLEYNYGVNFLNMAI
jgi:exonuclease SbcD